MAENFEVGLGGDQSATEFGPTPATDCGALEGQLVRIRTKWKRSPAPPSRENDQNPFSRTGLIAQQTLGMDDHQ